MMAFLNKGLEIRFADERADGKAAQVFKYTGGIIDYVRHLNASKEALFRKVALLQASPRTTMEVEVALQWNTGYYEGIHSFANGISTIEGGMHEEGFKKALTNVVNKYARAKGTAEGEGREPPGRGHPRGPDRHHLGPLRDPQFEGQTKAKLGNVADPLAGGAGHQREAGRVARGEPARGQPDRAKVDQPPPGPGWRPSRPAT